MCTCYTFVIVYGIFKLKYAYQEAPYLLIMCIFAT